MNNNRQYPKTPKEKRVYGSFFQCPFCRVSYTPDQFDVLESSARGVLYVVECLKCHHTLFGSFFFTDEGMSSIGMLTDFTKEDILKFRHKAPISADELLLLYEQWQKVK